jgi:hypothetical protein
VVWVVIGLSGILAPVASAHPGSGIVVDEQGRVFFVDTGNPDARTPGHILRIDAPGQLTSVHASGAHWLALDAAGSFAQADLRTWFDRRLTPNFERVPRTDANPTLLQTDGAPFIVHRDGNLYYVNPTSRSCGCRRTAPRRWSPPT